MSKPETPAQVLRAAADLIESKGKLARGVYGRGRDGYEMDDYELRNSATTAESIRCVCAAGAVLVVSGGEWGTDRLKKPLDAIQAAVVADGWPTIPDWNDNPRTSAADVVATMRRVADDLEAVPS